MNKFDTIRGSSRATENAPRKSPLKLVAVLIILISLISVPLIALFRYGETLQNQNYPNLEVQAGASPYDCGIVLTGGPGRIREGLAMLSRKDIKKLVISGVNPKATLIEIFPDLVFYPDINLQDVILERRSGTTASNAQHSLPIAEALNCKNSLLITADYHMYRALRTFKTVFPTAISLTPMVVNTDVLKPHTKWYFTLKGWALVSEEALKFLFYEMTVF